MIFFEIVREARVDSRIKLGIEVYSSQYIQRINLSAKNSLPVLFAWKFYFTLKPPTITFPSKPNTYTPLHDPL